MAVVAGAFVLMAALVVSFTHAWTRGGLLIDGPGVSLWLQVVLDHWRAGYGLSYWMPEMWTGTPFFALFPSFHLLMLVPLAALWGPDTAVKAATVAAQVAGAWGAFVLARSLWGRMWAAVVAGVAYGCHPYFVASGALFGQEASVWVFAVTPWLIWSLRLALRGDGAVYVALAGLFAGFAVLQQAEHAFGLALLCALLVLIAAVRARRLGRRPRGAGGVMFRAGVVVVLALGTTAFWLVPFLVMKDAFVLTPPSDVRASLDLLSGALGRRPGAFLTRAGPEAVTYDFGRLVEDFLAMKGNVAASFYLGWAAVVGTLVTVVLIARRNDDDDGTLCAVLIASVLGIWLSLGTVPLAGSNLTTVSGAGALVVVGTLSGLLIGAFLRRLQLGRRAVAWAVACALALFAAPYVSPIVAAQRFVPFLEYIRFPRFWPLAAMGVALGAAYPLVVLQRWAESRQRRLAPLFGAATALAMCGILFADLAPYRGYYAMQMPRNAQAYDDAVAPLRENMVGARVALPTYGDPLTVDNLIIRGVDVTTGWPHPLAEKYVYQLTAKAFNAPAGYRDAALGLAATGYLGGEVLSLPGEEPRRIESVRFDPNPSVLPLVRAYRQVVLLDDESVAPELATALGQRRIGVVSGVREEALAGLDVAHVPSGDACEEATIPGSMNAAVAREVAMACALKRWVGETTGRPAISIADGVGAIFDAPLEGLSGIAVWLNQGPDRTIFSLYEVGPDGRSLGNEVRRGLFSGYDHNDMAAFRFEPVPSGQRYAFVLTCPECGEDEAAEVFRSDAGPERTTLVGDELRGGIALSYSPIYDRVPMAPPTPTRLSPERAGPGEWRIGVDGPEAALVVVAEANFPGWKAKVDGRPATLVRADAAFLGVVVPPGAHTVSLSYHKPTAALTVGRALTGVTLLACALMVAYGRPWRRRARPAPPADGSRSPGGPPGSQRAAGQRAAGAAGGRAA
ncbi:MAG: YfhO family protein, partial [Actinomycetota bacterium]